jgi:hypothetical protein
VPRDARGTADRLAAVALCALLGSAARGVAVELDAGGLHGRFAGSLTGWHVFRLDDDTPREYPSALLDLHLDAERGKSLHLFTSFRAGYDGKIGDPDRDLPFYDPEQIYQDRDVFVDFPEAYVDVYAGPFELRLGRQKIFWGQLDDIQPTDHLNPEDLTEFFFRPEAERKIGIPAARLAGYRGPWSAELVWSPVYSANRVPNREDRWFPPLLEVPARIATPLGLVPVRTRYPDVDAPAHALESSDVGLRVTRFVRGAEVSGSLFHGWDKGVTFGARGRGTLVPTGNPAAPAAPQVALEVFPSLHRITVVGADFAVPVWLLALRGEAAWIAGRFHPLLIREQVGTNPRVLAAMNRAAARAVASGRRVTVRLPLPPLELERDTIQYGIGFDLNVNEYLSRALVRSEALAGTFVLVQLLETVILDHDDAAAFIADEVEHLLVATLRRTFRHEQVATELKLAYNPNHGDLLFWPQLTYKVTPLTHVILEGRVLAGDPTQTIGQYRDHDGIRVGLRRYF